MAYPKFVQPTFNKKYPNPRPAFYAALLGQLRELTIPLGYELAIHGSMNHDGDLIACAWRDDACSDEELFRTLWNEVSAFCCTQDKDFERYCKRLIRPGGRIVYILPIWGDAYIDLVVYPPREISETSKLVDV